MRFEDKIAVITGAGRGIGRACAARIASEGGTVNILDQDEAAARDAAAAIVFAHGKAHAMTVDVAVAQQVSDAIVQRHGRVGILINNAGYLRAGTAVTQTIEDWDRTVAVNIRSMFILSRATLPGMVEGGRRTIVNRLDGRHGPRVDLPQDQPSGLRAHRAPGSLTAIQCAYSFAADKTVPRPL